MEVWDRVEHTEAAGSKYKMTYVHPHIYINKQISQIFNCVTPVSVLLAANYCMYNYHSGALWGEGGGAWYIFLNLVCRPFP